MSNTKTLHTLFSQRVTGKKLLLYVLAAMVLVTDAAVAAVAIHSGVPVSYWILPLLFAVLDLLLIPAIYFSNFRFLHGHVFPVVYTVASLVITVVIFAGAVSAIFTVAAAVLFLAAHLLMPAVLTLTLYNAAKLGKKPKTLANLLLIGAFFAVALLYMLGAFANGFYGQGSASQTRTVVYELDGRTDTYTVRAVLDGRADHVVIPEEHNGKRVATVDAAIFDDSSLRRVYLACGADVNFHSTSSSREIRAEILLDKSEVDTMKDKLLEQAKTNAAYISLCNAIVPDGLAADEVYITFAYTAQGLEYAKYLQIPTWFGKVGDVFSLSEHATGVYYAEGYDPADEGFLAKCYHNGKKVLQPLAVNGKTINGTAITQSAHGVSVDFSDVYALLIGEDNDTKYEVSDTFKRYGDENCRFVLAGDPQDLLAGIPKREGFTVSFEYEYANSQRLPMTDLASVLSHRTMTVYPMWQLNAPDILEISTGNDENAFFYGDNIIFSGRFKAPVEGVDLRYEWSSPSGVIGTEQTHTVSNVFPSQTGNYALRLIAYSDTVTSLVSESVQVIPVTVSKRPLAFAWTLPGDTVYSGTDKTISAAVESSNLVNGDAVTYEVDLTTVRQVGVYTSTVALTENWGELYEIKAADRQRTVTVTPYTVQLTWTGSSFVYDATEHIPTAEAFGVGDDSAVSLPIQVSGGAVNASDSLTASAVVLNENYTAANPAFPYTIAKRPISLDWEDTLTFVYDGTEHGPRVELITGAVSGEEQAVLASLSYVGHAKKASNTHRVIAAVTDPNYRIESGCEQPYVISPKPLTLTWPTNRDLTYNGRAQKIAPVVSGVVSGENVTLGYTAWDSHVNVDSYSVTVSITNSNYELPANVTCDYRITAAPLTLTWPTNRDLTYNGRAQKIAPVVSGLVNGERVTLDYTAWDSHVNVDSYSVTVSITNSNYALPANVSCNYRITAAPLTLQWSAVKDLPYTGKAQKISATVSGMVNGESVELSYSDWSNHIDADTYEVEVSISDNNYALPANKTCEYRITPALLSLSWDAVRELPYTGKAQKISATVSGMVNGESVTLSYSDWSNHIDADTYEVEVSISDNNYALPANKTCEYRITPVLLSLSWDVVKDLPYTGKAQRISATVSGMVNGESVELSYSDWSGNINAASYEIKALVTDKNYVLPADDTCGYAITPIALTLSWPAQTVLTYTGTAQKLTPTVSGTVNGESITLSYSDWSNHIDVGSYEVEVSLNNGNYTLPANVKCAYSIAPATLTVAWPSGTSLAWTGAPLAFEANVTGLAARDGSVLAYTYYNSENQPLVGAPTEAGSYRVELTVSGGNYVQPANNSATFLIVQGGE